MVLALIILIGILISKVYCFVIVNRVYREINEFREAENRYYAVTTFRDKEFKCREEIFKKENEIKYLKLTGNLSKVYLEFKNFSTDEKYYWITKADGSKILERKELYIKDKEFISGIPSLMSEIYSNNKFNLKEFLRVYYSIPINYKGKSCYKMVTKSDIIIIDRSTYLPIYVSEERTNSEEENKYEVEYFYEFKTNAITDKNMK